MELDNLERQFLVRSAEDEMGMWEVASIMTGPGSRHSTSHAQRIEAFQALQSLLEKKLIRAGEYRQGTGYLWWPESPADIILRIERAWSSLGRDPDIGEIGLFMTTPSGEALAKSLVQN